MKEPKMECADQDISSLLSALRFSAERHRDQRRKDAESTPYINHPIQVAEILWRVGGVRDLKVIVGALLHDIIEDTETEPQEIEQLFGSEVLSIVLEVTDDKSLPKTERKLLQIERASGLSQAAKLIKIADKICNVRDVISSPPAKWSQERRVEYLKWTKKVVAGLRGCNQALESLYRDIVEEGEGLLSAVGGDLHET
jgi:guanosine-3',5'-bis(diphosphate) 3'-pyrophosphohydrolase